MVAGETIVLANSVLVFTFAYLALHTKDEHAPLRLFYHLFTFFWTYVTLAMGLNTVSNNGLTRGLMLQLFQSFSWVLWLIVAYFFIYLLSRVLNDLFVEA